MLFGLPLDSLPGFNDPVPGVLAVVHHKSQQSDPALWAGRSVQLTQAGKRTLARARTPPPPHPTDRRSSIVPHSPATSESEPVQESRWAIQHLCHAIFVDFAPFLVGFSVMGGAEYILVSAGLAAAWNVHSGFAADGLYESFTCFFLVVSRPSMASLIWAATGAQGCYWRLLLKPIATGPSGVEEPAFTSSPSACHLLCSSKVSPIHLLTGFGERC